MDRTHIDWARAAIGCAEQTNRGGSSLLRRYRTIQTSCQDTTLTTAAFICEDARRKDAFRHSYGDLDADNRCLWIECTGPAPDVHQWLSDFRLPRLQETDIAILYSPTATGGVNMRKRDDKTDANALMLQVLVYSDDLYKEQPLYQVIGEQLRSQGLRWVIIRKGIVWHRAERDDTHWLRRIRSVKAHAQYPVEIQAIDTSALVASTVLALAETLQHCAMVTTFPVKLLHAAQTRD